MKVSIEGNHELLTAITMAQLQKPAVNCSHNHESQFLPIIVYLGICARKATKERSKGLPGQLRWPPGEMFGDHWGTSHEPKVWAAETMSRQEGKARREGGRDGILQTVVLSQVDLFS